MFLLGLAWKLVRGGVAALVDPLTSTRGSRGQALHEIYKARCSVSVAQHDMVDDVNPADTMTMIRGVFGTENSSGGARAPAVCNLGSASRWLSAEIRQSMQVISLLEGPSTQYLRFRAPKAKTISSLSVGTRNLKYWVPGACGVYRARAEMQAPCIVCIVVLSLQGSKYRCNNANFEA